MRNKLLRFLVVVVLLMPMVASAQANPDPGGTDLGRCVSQIYVWSLGASGLLAMVMCVWGGYQVMTARGNAAQSSSGKQRIYSALLGMVILFGAYIILNTINPDLTRLDSPALDTLNAPAGPPAGP